MGASSKILDGKWLSRQLLALVKAEVDQLQAKGLRVPGLGVILVGDNPASHTYVANKEKLARTCGFRTLDRRLDSSASFDQVKQAIQEFNSSPEVDGILLQLPLPKPLQPFTNTLLDLISPQKDADGLHPLNQGLLQRGEGSQKPCTPLGVMKLIDLALSTQDCSPDSVLSAELESRDLSGRQAVVLGRSILVGKPVATMLLERNATVTMAHSKTAHLSEICRTADILVAAVGKAELVSRDWIKSGAIVIDVGMNRLENGKLVGDVAFEEVADLCSAITPVPGGVGPMTIAMLIQNTLRAYKVHLNHSK